MAEQQYDYGDLEAKPASYDYGDLEAKQPSLAERQAASKATFEANQPESHLGMNLSSGTFLTELERRSSRFFFGPKEGEPGYSPSVGAASSLGAISTGGPATEGMGLIEGFRKGPLVGPILSRTPSVSTLTRAVLSPREFLKQKAAEVTAAAEEARMAAANEEAARIASTGTTEKPPLEPSRHLLNIPRPGVSPTNQSLLDQLRSGTPTPDQEAAMEKAWANRGNFEPEPDPWRNWSELPRSKTVYKPAPDTGLPSLTPATDAPALNKAMNISEKQVARGANPGKRVLDEKLLAKTPEETADNVKMALDDSSGKLASALRQATKKGVTIDAQDTVLEALNDAQKRIGTPRDILFQNQLNGVLDDIMKRYPKLGALTPEEAHALKVELGDAIQWSGTGYDAPVNRAMVRIYSEMNSQLKDIDGVASEQSRWGDLYNASKGLMKTINRKVVGRGVWLK